MSKLVLVRHGLSEWNKLGLWTGWRDIPLAPEGFEEAKKTAEDLHDIHFDYAFTSDLVRSQQTFKTIEEALGYEIPFSIAPQIKERDYGDLTEKNKWQIKEEFGEEQFNKWRRGWDDVVPNGENLKQVSERAVPFFKKVILAMVMQNKNVLVCAHSNSLRAIIKYLDNVPDTDVANVTINTGEAYVYDIDSAGKIISKEVRAVNTNKV